MKKYSLMLLALVIVTSSMLLQCVPLQGVAMVGETGIFRGSSETPASSPTTTSPNTSNPSSPITQFYIDKINGLFKQNNLKDAYVELDHLGRIKLKGSYKNEEEVDVAFSLAQQTVGVKWVSPVDPENVTVPGWSKKLSEIFARAAVKSPPVKNSNGPPGPIKNKYALVVGIGEFQSSKADPLHYAKKDATDFYNYLTAASKGGFSRKNVTLLLSEKATRKNIRNALDDLKNKAKEDDLVVLYISTHGTQPDKSGNVFIVTHDSVLKPVEIWHTSITHETLGVFIQGIRAKRFVAILDVCYSSGAFKGIKGFVPEGAKSLGVEDETYGIGKEQARKMIGSKDIVLEGSINLSSNSKGWGKVLISASGENEKSWEDASINNSYFTHYLIAGLEENKGSVANAFDYAKPKVTVGVLQDKNASQNPHVEWDNKDWNIKLGK
ncbi:MAG: caspase family protein [Nitrospirae bacterium]|nr:caspase family protein [Nitrospirota bacterium]MBF0592021.1 caspase family protein [Nitrospirota bacterium]